MKVISTGKNFRIYSDNLKTYDNLPIGTYRINFSREEGFSLIEQPNVIINEKIYGNYINKADKVIKSFKLFNRNLGVILSGDKGMGKSIFAKKLAILGRDSGYPLIIVNQYIPGIADYINSINQEVIVLFDEFDKTFSNSEDVTNSMADPQTELLTLFDGLGYGKKLFVITCNNIYKLNDYLLNRPGRFHYHFRFDYPDSKEIEEYLEDNLESMYYKEIEKVISFSNKVKLNYDCLRAIAFELSLGIEFKDAIKDLNIINMKEEYDIAIKFKNGEIVKIRDNYCMDMFDSKELKLDYSYENFWRSIIFNPTDCVYNKQLNTMQIDKEKVKIYTKDDDDNWIEDIQFYDKVDSLLIYYKINNGIHYMI